MLIPYDIIAVSDASIDRKYRYSFSILISYVVLASINFFSIYRHAQFFPEGR